MVPRTRGCIATLGVVAGILFCHGGAALALPSMIRLGYPTCAACHLSPQGRGLLTEYGKGIDEAESLRGGVYEERTKTPRVLQDVRLLSQLEHGVPAAGGDAQLLPLARLWYRNATFLSSHQRLSAVVSVDLPSRALTASAIQPAIDVPHVFVSRALWEYRPRPGLEIAVGRDALPSGVEIADQTTFIRARNEQGFGDVPTQAKLFWWSERFQVVPYVFAPSGHESAPYRNRGGGLLAEVITARQRLVIGISTRVSRNRTFDERLVGIYGRMGVGAWAFLTEWDVTTRRWRDAARLDADQIGGGGIELERGREIDQTTGFAQLLFHPRRWLIFALTAERARMYAPLAERRIRMRPELSMRLNHHVTVSASVRDQWISANRSTPTYLLQVYVKTAN